MGRELAFTERGLQVSYCMGELQCTLQISVVSPYAYQHLFDDLDRWDCHTRFFDHCGIWIFALFPAGRGPAFLCPDRDDSDPGKSHIHSQLLCLCELSPLERNVSPNPSAFVLWQCSLYFSSAAKLQEYSG